MIAPIRRPAGSEKENPDSVDHLRSAQAGEQEENSFCLVLHSSYPRRGKYSYRRYSGAKRCDSNGWSLRESLDNEIGPVAELVGIEGGVVSGVFNLESSGVEAPDRRPRHEEHYHEVRFLAACGRDGWPPFRRLV